MTVVVVGSSNGQTALKSEQPQLKHIGVWGREGNLCSFVWFQGVGIDIKFQSSKLFAIASSREGFLF